MAQKKMKIKKIHLIFNMNGDLNGYSCYRGKKKSSEMNVRLFRQIA